MSTLSTAMKNALLDLIDSTINAGGAGTAEFQTPGGVEVATATLSNPAFAAASGGAMVLDTVTEDSDATGGIMTQCVFKTNGGTAVITFTVGTADAEITFTTTTITLHDRVGISAFTLTF